MKKLIYLFLCFFLIGSLSFTNSCKKDNKIKGCTDLNAQNYDATAEENDGSCTYIGKYVIWYDKTASEGLISNNSTSLIFYIGSTPVDTIATSVYWTEAPECDATGTVSITEDLGKVKSKAYALSVVDQAGNEYMNSIAINFEANTCVQFQLVWTAKKKMTTKMSFTR